MEPLHTNGHIGELQRRDYVDMLTGCNCSLTDGASDCQKHRLAPLCCKSCHKETDLIQAVLLHTWSVPGTDVRRDTEGASLDTCYLII